MRVLALASYPTDAAATRFRIEQLVTPLRKLDVSVDLRPFLSPSAFRGFYQGNTRARAAAAVAAGLGRRLADTHRIGTADVGLIQREAALIGPPLFEALLASRRSYVLDLDDPTWVGYNSPTYGHVARALKWPSKAIWLIRHAAVVTCGSQAILKFVESQGADARLLPTVVDTDVFQPETKRDDGIRPPLVGWIGTHSTFPYLQAVLPAIRSVAERRPFRLLIVGGGTVEVPGIEVEIRDWTLKRETRDFQSLDIGLYPLLDDGWAGGKSGFKAIQYMAVGVPFITTPLGATTSIGEPGRTHLEARDLREWEEGLERLVTDSSRRQEMGQFGRAYCTTHYRVEDAAEVMARALSDAAQTRGRRYPLAAHDL